MSVNTAETSVIVPEFSADLITATFAEVKELSPGKFQKDELAIMDERNFPLVELHGYILGMAAGESRSSQEVNSRSAGYLLGHRVLRLAGDDKVLPTRIPLVIEGYMRYLGADDGALVREFDNDYARHQAVVGMVNEKLSNPDSKYGAMLIFALYGGWANPEHKPIRLPPPPESKAGQRRQHAFVGNRHGTGLSQSAR